MIPVCLTIAGSDPGGGAGVQADLKVFHQHQVYGASALTLLTVQDSCGVYDVRWLDCDLVMAQLEAVLQDLPVAAAKTGALGSAATVKALAARLARETFPLVVDPVITSTHGKELLEGGALELLRKELLPAAYLVTPNVPEASLLAGVEITSREQMGEAARAIADFGARNVLIKGGHLAGDPVDVLYHQGELCELPGTRMDTPHTHGTGCVLSAAITARLGSGEALSEAVCGAKRYIEAAIRSSPGLGRGRGPTNMHAATGTRRES